jgi:hypothetical protein
MQELPVQFGTGTPTGPDWHTLSSINAAVIGEWLDAFRSGGAQGRTDVAGVWLAGYLASAIASPLAISLHHHGFGWPLSSGVLAVRRHAGGWFDRVAVSASPSSLSEADLARDLVGVLSPIFALIRSQTRLGWPVLWGTLGDAITAALVDHASSIGASPSSAWDAGLRFVDQLAVHAPQVRARRQLVDVPWSGGSSSPARGDRAAIPAGHARISAFVVRGVCCLYYRVAPMEERSDECGKCTHCPLRSPDGRVRRWQAYLADADAVAPGQ